MYVVHYITSAFSMPIYFSSQGALPCAFILYTTAVIHAGNLFCSTHDAWLLSVYMYMYYYKTLPVFSHFFIYKKQWGVLFFTSSPQAKIFVILNMKTVVCRKNLYKIQHFWMDPTSTVCWDNRRMSIQLLHLVVTERHILTIFMTL